jgi:hypothetical protein
MSKKMTKENRVANGSTGDGSEVSTSGENK